MQNSIYYYSATGNSLYIAKNLAESLGECYLASIPALRHDPEVVPQGKTVGLVFPMHYFGVPPIVKEFIEKLDVSKVDYFFAVATCGSTLLCSVLYEVKKLLAAKGRALDAGFYVRMVDNYLPVFPMPKEKVRCKILGKSDKKLAYVKEQIKQRRQCLEKEYLWPVCRPIHRYWLNKFDKIDSKFTNSDACTSCGMCAKACPVANIVMEAGRPSWQHHCQECLACLHICPANSIQFGRSQGKERYHHPALGWSEIIDAQTQK